MVKSWDWVGIIYFLSQLIPTGDVPNFCHVCSHLFSEMVTEWCPEWVATWPWPDQHWGHGKNVGTTFLLQKNSLPTMVAKFCLIWKTIILYILFGWTCILLNFGVFYWIYLHGDLFHKVTKGISPIFFFNLWNFLLLNDIPEQFLWFSMSAVLN